MVQSSECPRCGDALADRHFCSSLWQPPRAELSRSELHWDGAHLVVGTDSPIPAGDCWLCGTADGVRLRRCRFSYAPPWIYLSALGGPFGILLGGLLQRRVRFRIPLCLRCELRWDLGTLATLGAAVLGLPLWPLIGGVTLRALFGAEAFPAGGLLGVLVWITALVWTRHEVEMRLKVRCLRIAGGAATLAFPRPAVVRAALRGTTAGDEP